MDIIEKTELRLVIRDRPIVLPIFILAIGSFCILASSVSESMSSPGTVLLALLGIVAIFVALHFFPHQRFTFDKGDQTFQRQVVRVYKQKTSSQKLESDTRVVVETKLHEGMKVQRLAYSSKGETQMLEFGLYGKERTKLASEVNSWLSQP